MLKKLLVPMLLTSMVVGTVACGDDDNNGESSICSVAKEGGIYIAEALPFTGDLGTYGTKFAQAFILAITEINDAGGIHGQDLGFIKCDTATDPTTAAAAVQEIVNKYNVSGIIGPAASGSVMQSYQYAVDAQIPMITPSGSAETITAIDDDGYVFRTTASDGGQARVLVSIALREGYEKVFIIHRNDDWGAGLKDGFTAGFADATHTVDSYSYDGNDENFGFAAAAIEDAIDFSPDAVLLASFIGDGSAIVSQAITQSFAPAWLLTDGPKGADFITAVGDNDYLEGSIGTNPTDLSGPEYDAFATAYEAMWSEEPTIYTAHSYDAVYLLAIAMELAADPTNGTQVRDELANTFTGTSVGVGDWDQILSTADEGEMNYQGASGLVDFDTNGDVQSDINEWMIHNGQIVDETGCWHSDGTSFSCTQ